MRAINALALLAVAPFLGAQSTTDAVELFQRGQYGQAREMLEKIVARSPEDRAARTFLALSRAAMGNCEAALGDLEQQFRGNPDASLMRMAGIALVQCDLARNQAEAAWPVL